ncbi:MAG TPA: TIGR01777 family protein [Anaerolineales bacterium]|nr:TIGR01777 family protein [Anaerolineales bacterium]
MNVLMTGGSGLIGRSVAADLTRAGHRVTVLTRSPQKAAALLPPQVTAHPWDAISLNGWASLVNQAEAIINLAGESIAGENLTAILTRRWTADYKRRIAASRRKVGQLLTTAVEQAKNRPRVFVQASAVGYYGDSSERDVDESAPPGDDFLARVCADWEASTAPLEALGLRRVIIRTGLVLAPRGGILPVMLLPVRMFVGGPLGSGKQALPWIHLADEAAAIRALLEDENASGPYNLSAPNPVTQAEFVRIAGRVLRRPVFVPAPALALKLALGEKAALVLEGQRAVPKRLLAAGYRFQFPELAPALQDLLG